MSNDLSTPSLPASTVRAYVYRQVFDPTNKQGMGKRLDGYISTLIILNLIALLVEQVPTLYAKAPGFFHIFDVFSIIVFTIEYVLRLYVAPEDPEFKGARLPRFAYFKSPFALIDLAAILPFYLAAFIQIDLRMLRALRLLRLFKLARVPTQRLKAGRCMSTSIFSSSSGCWSPWRPSFWSPSILSITCSTLNSFC
ncbi:MAG: ion transporter [Betaproteobacteria bacterium]|nr:ion transporter [Betaproteobacteria bacterium]